MAVAITAGLVGSLSPQLVQVVVTGLTSGDAYSITGTLGGFTWPVRAGDGVVSGTQVVVYDSASPINVPVTYSVVVNEVAAATSAPVTVAWAPTDPANDACVLLSSLDGRSVAEFRFIRNGIPREYLTRAQAYAVPGRRRRVVVWDVAAGETAELVLRTDEQQSGQVEDLIYDGASLLLRSNGRIKDLEPVAYHHIMGARSSLWLNTIREWRLSTELIDDPEPNTLVAASTWDDFDLVYAAATFTAFDAEWTGRTMNDFDREDWDSRA